MPQQTLTPEKYIRTKVRSLPIDSCLINKHWEHHGLATIIVKRRHPKGTITGGIFIVDIFCMGVKDCLYIFNVQEEDFQEKIYHIAGNDYYEESYDYLHNIIFNSIEFAQSFDIAPHKDFNLCQYILEEEDSIAFIETPLGDETGKPLFLTTYEYPQNKVVINKLMHHFGEGGFKVLYKEDMESDDFEGYEDTEDDDFEDYADPLDFDIDYSDEDIDTINKKFSQHYTYHDHFEDKIQGLRQFIMSLQFINPSEAAEEDVWKNVKEEVLEFVASLEGYPENIDYNTAARKLDSILSEYPHIESLYFIYLRLCTASLDEKAEERGVEICNDLLEKFPQSIKTKIAVGKFYLEHQMKDKFGLVWTPPLSLEATLRHLRQFDKFDPAEVVEIAALFIDYYTSDPDGIESGEIIFEVFKDLEWFSKYKEEALRSLTIAKDDYLYVLGIPVFEDEL
jgi:hypothetical protein